jgi:uncharacterized protein (DUF433 family)
MDRRKKPKIWKVPFHNGLLIELRKRKCRTGEIAEKMGFSLTVIRRKTRELGLEPDQRGIKPVDDGKRDALIVNMSKTGLSNTELAKRFNLTSARIGQILKKAKSSGKVL